MYVLIKYFYHFLLANFDFFVGGIDNKINASLLLDFCIVSVFYLLANLTLKFFFLVFLLL
jgi:hypothetical protein